MREADAQVAHRQNRIRGRRRHPPRAFPAGHPARGVVVLGHGGGAGDAGAGRAQFGLVFVAHEKVFRGSKASRTPSKMKTRSDSMMAKVKKAVKASQGACRFCLACKASSPSEGADAGSP